VPICGRIQRYLLNQSLLGITAIGTLTFTHSVNPCPWSMPCVRAMVRVEETRSPTVAEMMNELKMKIRTWRSGADGETWRGTDSDATLALNLQNKYRGRETDERQHSGKARFDHFVTIFFLQTRSALLKVHRLHTNGKPGTKPSPRF